MRNDDAELIRRTLAGDETAFTMLVKKYHKHVHALAWRKIGDFHIAEDITQETFLRVYKHLTTLKELDRFPGWLYVIATRRCIAWLRKKRLNAQLVEDIDMVAKGKGTYSQYVADQQEKTSTEAKQEVVKQLLAKLQESERTVITLYYFGEMTCEEISKFLGVSVNTIKSRLSRARQRLRKEEPLIQEVLNNYQISTNLIENIIREVRDIKPTPSTGGKPVLPWTIAAATVISVVLILGIGNEYIARFQPPYSLEATSEMKVDIVETPATPTRQIKPAVKTQLGRTDIPGKNNGSNPQADTHRVRVPESKDTAVSTEEMHLEVLDFFRMPESGHLEYTVVHIDATAFEDDGTLTIDIRVGSGKAAGSFDLFHGDRELPTGGIRSTDNALAYQWGIPPGGTGVIVYPFDRGQTFQLGATGDYHSEKGSINAFQAHISIAGKRPGLGEKDPVPLSNDLNVILNPAQPSIEVLDTFQTPTAGFQDYTVVKIDATAFENGGTLTINIQVGRAAPVGSFDLFDGNSELPTEGTPEGALAHTWGIQPGETGTIIYRFGTGQIFRLGATGGWVGEEGNINAFRARISIQESIRQTQ